MLVLAAISVGAAILLAVILAAALRRDRTGLPCDSCGRYVPRRAIHTGHDIDCPSEATGWCRCDGQLCSTCCPCDVAGLLDAAS